MKLTQKKLKQMIIEEWTKLSEKEVQPPTATTDDVASSNVPGGDVKKDPTKSVSQLKKDLLAASQNIQNVKGLDPKEIELISATMGVILQLASSKSSATILQRIHDVLQKQNK